MTGSSLRTRRGCEALDPHCNVDSGARELENAMLARTLGPTFTDAWPSLRPEEHGWTFDSNFFYATGQKPGPDTLTVLTWNVWFDVWCRDQRACEVFARCRVTKPDVICFQEVTPDFLERLRRDALIAMYHVSDDSVQGLAVQPYGVLLLCRRARWPHRPTFLRHELPSRMSRELLTCDVRMGCELWTLATVHLESLNNAALREDS